MPEWLLKLAFIAYAIKCACDSAIYAFRATKDKEL